MSGSNLGIRSAWALQQQGTGDSPCLFKTLQTGDAKSEQGQEGPGVLCGLAVTASMASLP